MVLHRAEAREPRPHRRGAARHDRGRAPGGARGAARRSRVDRAWDPLHDRPRARPRDQRGEPADRRRADPRPHVRATRACPSCSTTTATSRRSPSTAGAPRAARTNAVLLTIGTGIGGGLIIDRRGLPRDDGRGRRARPHGDRRRRPALSGQLSQPRLRRGRRLGHRPRPRGAGGRRGATRTRRSGKPAGGGRRRRRPRRDGRGDRGRRGGARRRCADRPPDRGRAERSRERVRARRDRASAAASWPPASSSWGRCARRCARRALPPMNQTRRGGRRARPRSRHDRRRDHGARSSSKKPTDAGPPHRLPDPDREPRGLSASAPTPRAGGGRRRRLRGHAPHGAPVRAPRTSTRPRLVSNHEGNESERARQLAQAIERGAKVVLISDAGTPAISDPGYRLIQALHRARDRDRGAARALGGHRPRSSPRDCQPTGGGSRASCRAASGELESVLGGGETVVAFESPAPPARFAGRLGGAGARPARPRSAAS